MYSSDIRRIATNLYIRLNSLRKVSLIIETSHSTISRWVNCKSCLKHLSKNKKIETPIILEVMDLYIKTHPFASLKDVKNLIYEQFNIASSTELIRLVLKKLNFSRKRARYYSVPKNDEEKLQSFLEKRQQFINENRNFISIDETSFGRNYLPAVGYSKKGERLRIKRTNSRITTCSVVAAIGCEFGLNFYKKTGSFNTDSYYDFLNSLYLPEKTVLLMDNVRFHHSKKIKELAFVKKWDILYIPPYSPVFNPIEGVFSIVKRSYQQFQHIENSFGKVTSHHIKSFFQGSFKANKRF